MRDYYINTDLCGFIFILGEVEPKPQKSQKDNLYNGNGKSGLQNFFLRHLPCSKISCIFYYHK